MVKNGGFPNEVSFHNWTHHENTRKLELEWILVLQYPHLLCTCSQPPNKLLWVSTDRFILLHSAYGCFLKERLAHFSLGTLFRALQISVRSHNLTVVRLLGLSFTVCPASCLGPHCRLRILCSVVSFRATRTKIPQIAHLRLTPLSSDPLPSTAHHPPSPTNSTRAMAVRTAVRRMSMTSRTFLHRCYRSLHSTRGKPAGFPSHLHLTPGSTAMSTGWVSLSETLCWHSNWHRRWTARRMRVNGQACATNDVHKNVHA